MADEVESARTTVEYSGQRQFYDDIGMFHNPVNDDAPTITDPSDLAQGSGRTIIDFDPLIIESSKKTSTPRERSKLAKPSQEDNSKTVQSNEMIGSDSPDKRAKSSTPRRESDKQSHQGLAQPKSGVKSKAQHQSPANNTKYTEDDFEPLNVTGKATKNEPSLSSEGRVNLSKPSSETNNTIPHWLENAPRILKKAYEYNKLAKENPDAWLQQHEQYPRQLLGLFAVQASAPLTGLAGGLIGGGGIISTVVWGSVLGAAEVLIYDIVDDSTAEDYWQGAAWGAGGAIVGRYVLLPVFNKIIMVRLDRQIKKWAMVEKSLTTTIFSGQAVDVANSMKKGLKVMEPRHPGRAHYGRGVYGSPQREIAETYGPVVLKAEINLNEYIVLDVRRGAAKKAFEKYLEKFSLKEVWGIQENRLDIFEGFIQSYAPKTDVILAPHGDKTQIILRSKKILENFKFESSEPPAKST
ncbi:MAG: hypothetical protein K8S00_00560 [Bacteroidales bacterium]|nr:hypothetical protein [Bacteroidales bacterium]